jgi:hypothetical protein
MGTLGSLSCGGGGGGGRLPRDVTVLLEATGGILLLREGAVEEPAATEVSIGGMAGRALEKRERPWPWAGTASEAGGIVLDSLGLPREWCHR